MAAVWPRALAVVVFVVMMTTADGLHNPTIQSSGILVWGTQKQLTCYIVVTQVGSAVPLLEWTKNSVTLSGTSSSSVTGNTVTQTLVLSFTVAGDDDEATYYCSASYNSQSSQASVVLYVYNYPNPPVVSGPTSVVADTTRTWTCVVEGASHQSPSITWKFGNDTNVQNDLYDQSGTTYVNSTNQLESFNETSQLTLNITDGASSFSIRCIGSQSNTGESPSTLYSITVAYPPTVTITSSTVSAEVGTTATLGCSAVATPAVTSVTWYKDGAAVSSTDSRFSWSHSQTASLTISSLEKGDAGSYICSGTNTVATRNSSAVTLVVRYGPTITYSQNPVGGVLGEDLEVSCLIDAVPDYTNVYWYSVSSSTGALTTISSTSNPSKYSGGTAATTPNITIKNLATSDAGLYRCDADNDVGSGQGRNVEVEIYYLPQITVQESVNQTEPESATLPCIVDAHPEATVLTWYKGGQVLNTSDSALYSGGTLASPNLTIVSVAAEDADDYYCVASNSIGSTSSDTTTLTVLYFPILTMVQSSVTATEGDSLTLGVTVTSHPALDTVEWRHLGLGPTDTEVTVNVSASGYSGGTPSSPSLTITSVASSDAGVYTVLVTNAVGTRQANVTVTVSYVPTTPTVTKNNDTYYEGDAITLTCSSTGTPSPQYRWYSGSDTLLDTGSTLSYSSATPEQAGDYRCEAYNSVGTASTTVTVVVYYKPRAGSISNVTANTGDTATLDCATDANPAPTSYSWTKGGVTMGSASSSSTLTISSIASDDFGRYDCVATNTQGSSDPIHVFLLDKGSTGQSTEDTGLSTATLILIIIVCIIIFIIIIFVIIYCCASGRCGCLKKDNDVSPSEVAQPAPAVVPISDKPPPTVAASTPNGHVMTSANGTKSVGMDMDDDKMALPLSSNGTAALGHGLSISVPGGSTPRPHHLPPLGQDGVSEETESAREDKPKKRKRRRRRNEAVDTGVKDGDDIEV